MPRRTADATRRLDEDVNTDEDEEIDRMADGGGSTSSGAGRAGAAAPAAARAGAPRAPRREPLADDVTVDELAGKKKKPKAPRKTSSDDQYHTATRPRASGGQSSSRTPAGTPRRRRC